MVEDAPPGFNLPGIVTVHSDGTFQAVDGGDFGALTDLPFNQASQHGVWEWLGGNRYLQKGLMLSFSREPGSEGQLANILGSQIEIDLDPACSGVGPAYPQPGREAVLLLAKLSLQHSGEQSYYTLIPLCLVAHVAVSKIPCFFLIFTLG